MFLKSIGSNGESMSASVGDDNFGRKVIVFNACRMPPQHQLDHHKLLM